MRSKGYKCSNVKCNSCIAHCMCGEFGDAAVNCVDRIITRQTNADRIRSMSDEELAWYLMLWRCEAVAKHNGVSSEYTDTQKNILNWLQQPSE